MDRTKLIEAILEKFRTNPHYLQEQQLTEALRYMSDSQMVMYANEIGVNTDILFTKEPK